MIGFTSIIIILDTHSDRSRGILNQSTIIDSHLCYAWQIDELPLLWCTIFAVVWVRSVPYSPVDIPLELEVVVVTTII